jgi:MYXO-CTERM domain-containing protein
MSVGALLVPRTTEACSWVGSSAILSPSSGEPHPAGAGLLFYVVEAPLDVYRVTVDDEPAALTIEQMIVGGQINHLVVAKIDPPPESGQVVVVSLCGTRTQPEYFECPPDSPFTPVLEYTAGPPDEVPPASAGAVTLAHEFGTFEYFCELTAPLRFDVGITELDPRETDFLYIVELRDANGTPAATRAVHIDAPKTELELSIVFQEALRDPDNACVSVNAVDLSGNTTLVAEHCGSESIPPEGTTGTGTDDGATTAADSSGGEDEASTTGGLLPGEGSGDGASTGKPSATGEVSERGCGCRMQADVPTAWWLAVLGIPAIRRRQ